MSETEVTIKENRENILSVTKLILAHCDGAVSKDKSGFDKFDAVTVRWILYPDVFGVTELSNAELEYLRQKLLRYLNQLRRIGKYYGFTKEQIEDACHKIETPISDYSVFIRGKVNGKCYGRISEKWLQENVLECLQ